MVVWQELWLHGQTLIVTLYNNTFSWVFKNPFLVICLISCLMYDVIPPLPPFRIYISFHSISVLILSVFLDDKINYLFLESVCWRGWEKGRKITPGLDFFVYPFCYRVIVTFQKPSWCVCLMKNWIWQQIQERTRVAMCGYLKICNRSALWIWNWRAISCKPLFSCHAVSSFRKLMV